MTDTPIIFSADMVHALLHGRKTQTRRLAHKRSKNQNAERVMQRPDLKVIGTDIYDPTPWQKVQAGDRLWVRENWRPKISHSCGEMGCDCDSVDVTYQADGSVQYFSGWEIDNADRDWTMPTQATFGVVPCIHMPRWASRVTLLVTAARIEKVQDISVQDAIAEGITPCETAGFYRREGLEWGEVPADMPDEAPWYLADYSAKAGDDYAVTWSPQDSFRALWESLHGPGSWAANPEVVALTFTVHKSNIDKLENPQ